LLFSYAASSASISLCKEHERSAKMIAWSEVEPVEWVGIFIAAIVAVVLLVYLIRFGYNVRAEIVEHRKNNPGGPPSSRRWVASARPSSPAKDFLVGPDLYGSQGIVGDL
jgi:hypothetical protein